MKTKLRSKKPPARKSTVPAVDVERLVPPVAPFRWDWPKQKLLSEDGDIGDCWRCCIAAVLQKPAEEVPHFLEQVLKNHGSLCADTQIWLNERGYWLIQTRGENTLQVPRWGGEKGGKFPQPPIIACGPTVRSKKPGQHHAVVMQDGKLVYDPHPWQCGILTVTEQYVIVPTYWRNEPS